MSCKPVVYVSLVCHMSFNIIVTVVMTHDNMKPTEILEALHEK